MKEVVKQEKEMSSSIMEEQDKAIANTLVECKVMLKEQGELIRKLLVGQSPVIKEFSKRMEELENNTKEEAMHLEVVSRNFEEGGKFVWNTATKVEKIQADLNGFTATSRQEFDAFRTEMRREFNAFVNRNFEAMTLMQELFGKLKREIMVSRNSEILTLKWIIFGLFVLFGVILSVVCYWHFSSGH
jgi:hypothetical protein